MGKPNFSEDFKRDAVQHIMLRGYPVREMSERLDERLLALQMDEFVRQSRITGVICGP